MNKDKSRREPRIQIKNNLAMHGSVVDIKYLGREIHLAAVSMFRQICIGLPYPLPALETGSTIPTTNHDHNEKH